MGMTIEADDFNLPHKRLKSCHPEKTGIRNSTQGFPTFVIPFVKGIQEEPLADGRIPLLDSAKASLRAPLPKK